MMKTCALEGCGKTWESTNDRRKYCCDEHTLYARNHRPGASEPRLKWQRNNRAYRNEYQRNWRAKRKGTWQVGG